VSIAQTIADAIIKEVGLKAALAAVSVGEEYAKYQTDPVGFAEKVLGLAKQDFSSGRDRKNLPMVP